MWLLPHHYQKISQSIYTWGGGPMMQEYVCLCAMSNVLLLTQVGQLSKITLLFSQWQREAELYWLNLCPYLWNLHNWINSVHVLEFNQQMTLPCELISDKNTGGKWFPQPTMWIEQKIKKCFYFFTLLSKNFYFTQ